MEEVVEEVVEHDQDGVEYYSIQMSDDGSHQNNRLEEAELIINLQTAQRRSNHTESPTVTISTEPDPVKDGMKLPVTSGETTLTVERKSEHRCYICEATFKTITELLRHRIQHNTLIEKSFTCSMCDEVFFDINALEQHRLLHVEIRVYRCSQCLSTFDDLEAYKVHERVHEDEGPFVCNICTKVFNKKRLYLDHHYEHENGHPPPKKDSHIQCDICNKTFPEMHKLRRHMMYHNGEKFHKCGVCQKTFVERSKLSRHMLTHTGKKDFPCPMCNKSFTLKHNMTQHMNIHKGIKPFLCGICNRSFTQKIILQRHLKIHTGYMEEPEDDS